MASDLIFIVGRQRSGTTVFRDLLKRSGGYDCDEIFHGDLSRPDRFFSFVLERIAKEPGAVHPQTHPRLFNQFIGRLREQAAGRPLAIDVKYFGLNVIPTREDVDSRSPFLLNYMKREKAHVVHIIRRNKLRVLVSQRLSEQTGKWSAEKKEQLVAKKPRLVLDPMETRHFIEKQTELDKRVAQLMQQIETAHVLLYEEMFGPDGRFSEATQRIACTVMGLPQVDPMPGNLQMNPEPLNLLVDNLNEIKLSLEGTDHAWMLG